MIRLRVCCSQLCTACGSDATNCFMMAFLLGGNMFFHAAPTCWEHIQCPHRVLGQLLSRLRGPDRQRIHTRLILMLLWEMQIWQDLAVWCGIPMVRSWPLQRLVRSTSNPLLWRRFFASGGRLD